MTDSMYLRLWIFRARKYYPGPRAHGPVPGEERGWLHPAQRSAYPAQPTVPPFHLVPSSRRDVVWSSCSREDTQNLTTECRRADPQPTEPAPQGHTTTGGGGRDRPPSLPPLPPPRVEEERAEKGPCHPSHPRGVMGPWPWAL